MDETKIPQNEEIKVYNKYISLVVLLLFSLSSLFFYNAFKVGLSWITNSLQDSFQSWVMILSYLLPSVCFCFYFYSSFVKPNKKITRIIYSSIVSVISIFNIVGIAILFPIFSSNADLGVYESLSTVAFVFPYDGLIFNIIILFIQAYNFSLIIKPGHKFAYIKNAFTSYGFFRYSKHGFIGIAALGVVTMIFLGDFVCAFNAIENTLFDPKFIYLLLWILIIPLMNFIYFLVNPSIRKINEKTKIILYSINIGVNLIFGLLLLILELTSPSFIVGVGKPLFPIDYAISIPVGPIILLIISVTSIAVFTYRLVKSILIYKDTKKGN